MYCAFQYATSNGQVYEDKCFLSEEDAMSLFHAYLPKFVGHLESGMEPEMAVWVGMESDADYHTTKEHYHFSDFEVRNGELFKVTRIPVEF